MKRNGYMVSTLSCVVLLCMVAGAAFAQQPAAPAAGAAGAARQAPQPIPQFFRETWKQTPALVPLSQAAVSNPALELKMYGPTKEDTFNVTTEGNVPHIWTGLCTSSCALSLRNKDSYVDLTGKAKMRWLTKVSGFHEIRPIVKLADGTYLIGDHVDANIFDYHESEFFFSEVRWLKLDMTNTNVSTKGTLLDKVDLTKVDEIGFADLTPGSGHGTGGYSDVAWIEVYGKPVKRDVAAVSTTTAK